MTTLPSLKNFVPKFNTNTCLQWLNAPADRRSAVSLSPVSLRIMLLYANLYANYNNTCRELLKTISLIPNCRAGIRVFLRQHYTRRNISLLWYQTVGIRIFLRQHHICRNISLRPYPCSDTKLWYQNILKTTYSQDTNLLWYQTVGTRTRIPLNSSTRARIPKNGPKFSSSSKTLHLLFNW